MTVTKLPHFVYLRVCDETELNPLGVLLQVEDVQVVTAVPLT